MYTPDNWVLIKINNDEEVFYKVLAGWSGGYLDGDSWRLNSGVDHFVDHEDFIDFVGASGSVYRCSKHSECLRMNNGGAWNQMKERFGDQVELVDFSEAKSELREVKNADT